MKSLRTGEPNVYETRRDEREDYECCNMKNFEARIYDTPGFLVLLQYGEQRYPGPSVLGLDLALADTFSLIHLASKASCLEYVYVLVSDKDLKRREVFTLKM